MFLPQRWRRQPNRPVEVDYKNPITDSIWCAWNCHLTHDAVTGSGKFTTGGFGSGRARGVRVYRGEALHCSAPGLLAYLNTNVPGARADAPLTMLAGVCALSAGGMIFGCDCWSLRTTGANLNAQTLRVRLWPGALDHDSTATIDLSDTRRLQQIGFTWVPSTTGGYQPYFNGSPVGSAVNTSTTTQDPISLGWNSDGTGSGAGEGMYAWIFGWKRVLLAAEIAELNLNPWQIFRPVLERHIVLPSMHKATNYGKFLPRRWNRQPTRAVEIDQTNPLTRGLFRAQFFGSSVASLFYQSQRIHTPQGLATRLFFNITNDITATGPYTLAGRMVYPASGTSAWSSYFYVAQTTSFPGDHDSAGMTSNAAGNQRLAVFRKNTDGSDALSGSYAAGSIVDTFMSIVTTSSNQTVFEKTYGGSENSYTLTRNSLNAGTFATGKTRSVNCGDSTFRALYQALWLRTLATAERRELQVNPWQLWRPVYARTIFMPIKSPISTPQVMAMPTRIFGG